ncbi:hypothetical protein HDU81_003865 [Chytriomyces hyalinus]|nr:hypothetical protein HDU81_003865 [Chytriomyces hyalinus]
MEGILLEIQTLVYLYMALVVVAAVLLLLLVKVVLLDEVRYRGSVVLEQIITPFNLSLFLMPIANCLTYVGTLLSLSATDARDQLRFTIVADVGVALFQLTCVYYTWCRGLPIVEIAVPDAVPWMRRLVAVSPILLGLLPIPDILLLTNTSVEFAEPASKVVGVLCGLFVLVFDTVVLTVFVRYLRRGLTVMIQGDARLRIIARYGVATVCVGGASLVLIAAANSLDQQDYNNVVIFQILQITVFALFSVIHVILLAMKIALLRYRQSGNPASPTVASKNPTLTSNASVSKTQLQHWA